MTGFNRLTLRRPQGMNGPLRIPVSEIESYCRLMEFEGSKTREFLFYIEHMDDVYMEFVAKKIEEDEKKAELERQRNANKAKTRR